MVVDGQLDEAVQLVNAAVPMLANAAAQWQALDLLSQLWAKRGDPSRAAKLLACADRMYELHGFARKPHADRARAHLRNRFAEVLSDAKLTGLQAEGASLTEEQAVALAMDF